MPRRPIESGLGSPAQRGSGKSSGLVCFAKLKSFPARTGAECVSVSPLQAIGLVESLLDDIWLICGSVHPPLSSVKFRQVRFWQLDSKTNALFGSSPLKNLDFMGLFSYH